jgi:hypothetical protein
MAAVRLRPRGGRAAITAAIRAGRARGGPVIDPSNGAGAGLLARLAREAAEREAEGLTRRLAPGHRRRRAARPGRQRLPRARPRPAVIEAAAGAARTWGVGAGASRLVTGTTELHEQLEAELAAFCGQPSALVVSSGYLANLGAVTALAGRGCLVVSDAHVHASLSTPAGCPGPRGRHPRTPIPTRSPRRCSTGRRSTRWCSPSPCSACSATGPRWCPRRGLRAVRGGAGRRRGPCAGRQPAMEGGGWSPAPGWPDGRTSSSSPRSRRRWQPGRGRARPRRGREQLVNRAAELHLRHGPGAARGCGAPAPRCSWSSQSRTGGPRWPAPRGAWPRRSACRTRPPRCWLCRCPVR